VAARKRNFARPCSFIPSMALSMTSLFGTLMRHSSGWARFHFHSETPGQGVNRFYHERIGGSETKSIPRRLTGKTDSKTNH
jgi:hypothetical protein